MYESEYDGFICMNVCDLFRDLNISQILIFSPPNSNKIKHILIWHEQQDTTSTLKLFSSVSF
jgi:hypothetical protein